MGIFDRFRHTPTPAPVPDAPIKLTDKKAYAEWQNYLKLYQGSREVPTAKDIAESFKDTLADQIQEDASTRARTSTQLQSHDFVALAKIYQENNSEIQAVILGVMKELKAPSTVIKDFQDKNFAAYHPIASNKFKVYEGIGTDGKDTLVAVYETKSYRDEQAQVHTADGDSLYTKTMSGLTSDIISCIDSIQSFGDPVNVNPELIIDNDVDLSNFKLISDNEKIYPQNMSTKGCQLFERGYTNEPEAPCPSAKIIYKIQEDELDNKLPNLINTEKIAQIDKKIAAMNFSLVENTTDEKSTIVFDKILYTNDQYIIGRDEKDKWERVDLASGNLDTQVFREDIDTTCAAVTGKLTAKALDQLNSMVESRIRVKYGVPDHEEQKITSPIPKAAEQNIFSRPEGLSSLIKDAVAEKDNELVQPSKSIDSHDTR